MRLYRTGKASQLLGISKPTLIRKIKSGEIKAYRIGKEYRVPESEIKRILEGKIPDKVVIYARVSSRDQKEDLERQVEYLKNYCSSKGYQVAKIITDISSGLNENRKGLKQLLKLGGLALEDLTEIRESIRYSTEMNGRLHRWSFRKLQSIIEYKAKLKGVKVVFVNPAHTSSLCPVCGGKLSPNGGRVVKCSNCGFEADRDVVGSWNVRLRALKMWGVTVPPESPTMKLGVGKIIRNDAYELYTSYG
ncbi:IS607 family transposase [Thermococcus sp. 21S7]|uniref:IS607 family transposase n=1 Tax=Thermococcus sp. 21S7 TaxID=1638221 RepID=UPI00143A4C94|nr:IS607 family transposase [Thermococcus sp. 21S7]NJE60963.1 IS607 family transposase [Thermococcus sp. 21S7]